MAFESFIARRYLSSKNKPLFVSLLTWISLAGIAVSVFSAIFVMAVMEGFEKDFQRRVIGFKAPLMVKIPAGTDWKSLKEKIARLDSRITKVHPFAEGEAVLETEVGEAMGVRLRGIEGEPDPERYGEVDFVGTLQSGELLLGRELAHSLGLDPSFEEEVRILFPFGEISPSGEMLPRRRKGHLAGSFRSGFYEYDAKYVLLPIEDARGILADYARMGLEIWVNPIERVDEVQKVLQRNLPYEVTTWREQNPKLFSALKLERIGMFLLLLILLVVATCTIFGLISLTVVEKLKQAALFRSLGLAASKVRRIFMIEAAAIGLGGVLLGGTLGFAATLFLIKYPVRLPSTYYVEHLPLSLEPMNLLSVILLAPIVSVLASLYPARQSVRLPPAELLRYD